MIRLELINAFSKTFSLMAQQAPKEEVDKEAYNALLKAQTIILREFPHYNIGMPKAAQSLGWAHHDGIMYPEHWAYRFCILTENYNKKDCWKENQDLLEELFDLAGEVRDSVYGTLPIMLSAIDRHVKLIVDACPNIDVEKEYSADMKSVRVTFRDIEDPEFVANAIKELFEELTTYSRITVGYNVKNPKKYYLVAQIKPQ